MLWEEEGRVMVESAVGGGGESDGGECCGRRRGE